VKNYLQSLSRITAKDVLKFKNLKGKGKELQIGLALTYFLVAIDNTIMLSNDRKILI
jgi:hypothetical protein